MTSPQATLLNRSYCRHDGVAAIVEQDDGYQRQADGRTQCLIWNGMPKGGFQHKGVHGEDEAG